MVSKSRTEGRPILLACTQCRLRHLRCDGTLPYCSRCVASNAPCQYLKSRRGGKKKRKTSQDINHGIIHPSGQSEHRPTLEEQTGLGSIEFGAGIGSRASLTQSISSPEIGNHRNTEHNLSGTTPPALNPPLDQACGDVSLPEPALVSLYYEHFHNAHPILVPQDFYNERQYPEYLKTAVKLIGSRFLTDRPAASYTNSIQHIRSSEDGTVCLVQSRLLCSIFLCGQGDMELAKSFFILARDLAIDLQIYRYAILETHLLSYGELERESLKRTWWELFVADGYMTTIWPDLRFLTSTLDCDIPLPYDEGSNESQNSTPNCPPLGFDPDILFNEEEEVNLPTWWFRIKAVTLLWKVVSQSGSQAEKQIDDTASQTAMNALATWRLLLPEDKMTLMDPYGQVNKLMFEAETTVQFATILLHLSRSNLTSNTSMSTIISTTGPSLPIRSCTKEVHGIKATEASKDISNLFSIYPSMAKSSPWMISCLSLCGMVQLLTCYAHAPIRNCLETHRDRVRLLIGLLGSSGRIWQQAKTAQNILKTAAQETFQLLRTSKAPQEGPQPEKSSIPSANISSPMSWLPPELSNGNQEIGPWPWLASPSSQLFEAIDPLNNLYSYTADNQLP